MTLKRFTLVFALLALLTAGVSAHDDAPGPDGFKRMSIRHGGLRIVLDNPILLEATGLDSDALWAALMDGATIAELIEANEADVAAVTANVAAKMTEDINTQAASFLEDIEEQVSEQMKANHSRRGFWGRRRLQMPRLFAYAGVGDTIMQATGLDAAGLRSALAEGATIAELIEANDGDVASVSSDVAAAITDAVNAGTAERIANLETNITEIFNTDLADRWHGAKSRGFFGFWRSHGMSDNHSTSEASET